MAGRHSSNGAALSGGPVAVTCRAWVAYQAVFNGGKGRPRARRMLTDMTPTQRRLADLFNIQRYSPTR